MPKETDEQQAKRELDLELDEELENTFPASDALTITRSRPEQYRVRHERIDTGSKREEE